MIAVAALAGLVIGHLLDLYFDRLYTDSPLSGQLYRCSTCRSPLRSAFALPFVGNVWFRGSCPDCNKRLPWRALVLPLGSTMLFAISYVVFDELGAGLLGGFFATILLALTLTDLDRRLLPNRIIYPSVLLAAAFSWAWPESSVVEIFAGGAVAIAIAVGMLLFSLPFGGGAFGMGDVKMIVLIGFVVGFPSVLIAVVIGTLAGGAAAALLILLRLRTTRDYIPHGPFLALGAVTALFWGPDIWDWYTNR